MTIPLYEEFWGGPRDDDVRDSRLRKMLLRYVGLFHLQLPENDTPLTVLYRHLGGLTELDAMREGILEPSQLPEPSTAVEEWASVFCAAAERLAVRDHRADVEFARVFTLGAAPGDALPAADDYLLALFEGRILYLENLTAARIYVPESEPTLARFHDAVEAQTAWSVEALHVARVDLGRIATTEAAAGRLYELFFAFETYPGNGDVYDSYAGMTLETAVAMSNIGPCGYFEPSAFYAQPII